MMKKTFCALLLGLTLALTGCNAAKDSVAYDTEMTAPGVVMSKPATEAGGLGNGYYSMTESEEAIMDMEMSIAGGSSSSSVSDTRKIIRTANLTVQTKQFDLAAQMIPALAEQAGGYVESSYVSGNEYNAGEYSTRSASFTLRVPADKLDTVLEDMNGNEELFNITSRQVNQDDITDVYYDAATRLKSLQTQEERLLAMLETAGDLQYMIQLEEALANVRYQIENYYSTIQRYDSQVSMSTLRVDLREVMQYVSLPQTPKTYGERLGTAFVNSWRGFVDDAGDLFIELIYSLPGLLVLAAIFCAIFFPCRLAWKKRKARRAAAYDEACRKAREAQTPPEAPNK